RRQNEEAYREAGAPLQEPNHGVFIPPQQFMGQQERYAEEERQHAAHLCDIRLQNDAQRQINYNQEVLQHQAHLAELQQQRDQQREMEYQAHFAEVQCRREQQREMEEQQHRDHLAEVQR